MLTSMLQTTGPNTKRSADRNGKLEVQNTAEHFAIFNNVEKQYINKTNKYITKVILLEKENTFSLRKTRKVRIL
jgi:hypothetical protein